MRSCTEDCVVNGVHIRKGVSIRFPILKIHYDPNTWEEPSKFNPERYGNIASHAISDFGQWY